MARGRLIFPMLVELGLLDTAASSADPDGAGPLTSGYDDEYREPVVRAPASGSARGTVQHVERVARFRAQVEDDTGEALNMRAAGNSPTNALGLVFHYRDLEQAGAVSSVTGLPVIKAPGARLISIRDPRTQALIESYDRPPGMYATQARSMGFGIGHKRNLLLVLFQERDTSTQ